MYTAARLVSTGRAAVFLVTLSVIAARCQIPPIVTCGDSSPKGRAKGIAGSFLIMPNTLASGLTAWLPLRRSWRGSA